MSVRERIDIKSTGGRSEFHVKRPAGVTARVIGLKVEADNLFSAGSGATQSRAMRVQGDRAAANVMGGDAHDWLLEGAYTNRAVNTPAGSYCRGLSFAVQNRGSGELGSMQAALFSTRQRGDGGAVPEQRVLRADLTHDVGGAVSTGFHAPTPGQANGQTYDGVVADTTFSVDRGFYDAPFQVEITTDTPGATIHYTLTYIDASSDRGKEPNETTGQVYTGPITINQTACLRAIAFKTGWLSTNVDTHTYIFRRIFI